ncbi:hypothetical protein PGT21_009662 [Puccinia graminis f. sp. tritici]|uniref:DNL-type domain-containing protein n=2 Tax=Puccinia graminis f. sp. tritici TaxID=56615 RepID=E3K9H8_PUCGT|nr:uncharacterized protein PGTG_07338 [Puccinia graminis f. sp. tritici CRL 75-36-700-3]EFP81086.2 hypothetical protein PGTG_07338 [Puccinia graminis f. sp. tritici CRL 75-36-700-3]KAA1069031.1 hypothetical protein PGT21_009662 [Puccinia graminis f. sp. tritici]
MLSSTRNLTRLATRQLRNLSQKPAPIHSRKISQLTQQPSPVSEPTTYHTRRYNSTTSLSNPTLPEKEQQQEGETHDDQQSSTPGPSRMRIQFKCIAPSSSSSTSSLDPPPSDQQEATTTCDHLNTHEFSSQAFHHGIVLVQCPSCLNRHLIADHLQWFTSNRTSDDPNFKDDHRTIIDLMRAKGEAVKRGRVITSFQSNPTSQSPSSPSSQSDSPNVGEVLEFYQ